MMEKKYDIIFIGSGHANWHAAVALRQAGKTVAIIEEDTIAGTCTNYGCNAKILLDGPADVLHQVKAYKGVGITGEVKIDWAELMAYKQKTITPIHHEMEGIFNTLGIDVINGHGKFTDEHVVEVNNKEYYAENIIIGTGQRPALLNIPGKEYLHNSRDFLDLPALPKHITFIGAGIVSLEFAALARQAGAEVTVIEFADSALRGFYDKYTKRVVDSMKAQGIKFYFNEAVSEVVQTSNGLEVTTKADLKVATSYVIDATGRIPNVEKLGLENAGVAYNRRGIEVNDHLQTTQTNIFATGDVIDKMIPRLTPTATFESNYIAKLLSGKTKAALVYPPIASVVFTLPRIAQVGVTIQDAQKEPDKYTIKTITHGQRLLFQTKNEEQAEVTAVFDADKYLVGTAVYGDEAPELVNFLTMIIAHKMTIADLEKAVFAFPSQTIGILNFLEGSLKAE
ncbi:hypothetical protein FC19_GL001101 [Liquorilactobacillus aquaticus DSM 21051]|uniref:Glutathione reductase n=2 Tax=Liquorilactobacillus aquaticus TaxID=392566 RepID=A0A0R2D7Q0_9LACO|nr:hypothetical protein FC19_GL001101 [Liquorilactobacillus aquaticus DSM 21051]